MKHFNNPLAILLFLGFLPTLIFAQNVGIDVNPTKAKFEVWGTNDPVNGLGTVAVFGSDGTGISLQRNWPTIGFNQYRDKFNEERRLGAGKASNLYFEPTNGNFGWDVYSNSGTANSLLAGSGVTRAITILNNGNIGLRTLGLSDASLWVARGINGSGSAVFSGTNFNSHFHYADTEDTYIRGGKNNSKLILNDIPGGKVGVGDDASNTALINSTLSVFGSLRMPGKIVYANTYTLTENDFTIIVDMQEILDQEFKIFFPAPTAASEGRIYVIKGKNMPTIDVEIPASVSNGTIRLYGSFDSPSKRQLYDNFHSAVFDSDYSTRDSVMIQCIEGLWTVISETYDKN